MTVRLRLPDRGRSPSGSPWVAAGLPGRWSGLPARRSAVRAHTAPVRTPRLFQRGVRGLAWRRFSAPLHGGARGNCATQRMGFPHTGQVGGGVSAGFTGSGGRQSKSAWMRSRFFFAAAPSQP